MAFSRTVIRVTTMKTTLLLCTLAICATAIYCAHQLKHPRFTLTDTSRLITYRIDHKLGTVWHVDADEVTEVHDPWLKLRVGSGKVKLDY